MESEIVAEFALAVKRFKMYPYFDVANYILMCMSVREDYLLQGSGTIVFSRLRPVACWFSSMLLCFAGGILGNFLLGESIITPIKSDRDIITASIVWYLVNYAPFDIAFKFCNYRVIKCAINLLKEIQRTNKVHHGILFGLKNFSGSYILVCLFGVLKGSASQHMKIFQRFVCGIWQPTGVDILKPAVVTKGSLIASILFIVHHKGLLELSSEYLYLVIIISFLLLRITACFNVDPFKPFEHFFCAVFMGGVIDSLRRAAVQPEDNFINTASSTVTKKNLIMKTKEE